MTLKNAYVAPPPPKVQVAQPLQKPVTEYLELTGNTQAFATVDLVARVQGFLTSINYVDGATVKKGAQLFGIERDIYQAQVNQQEATLASDQATEEYNKAEYGRQATLARQDFASQATAQEWKSKWDQSAADILNAQAAIWLAKINLGYTQVLAPFDGVVTNHLVDVGALVGVSGPTKPPRSSRPIRFTSISPWPSRKSCRSSETSPRRNRVAHLETVRRPGRDRVQGEEGYPHKGHLDYASPQVDFATDADGARPIRQQGRRPLAGLVRAGAHADCAAGKGAADAKRRDRDEPGRELRAGRRPQQRRRAEGRHDGGPRWTAARDRIGLEPRRLGGDRRHSARLSRRKG